MAGGQGTSSSQGPPYPPQDAGLGGVPSVIPDVPVSAVFLALYLVFGIVHIRILKSNKNRGHRFIFNGAILGLCKIRIITMALRIVWGRYPSNTGLAMAANIFVYAGTIILYGVNWFFVQRIVRAQHVDRGWSTQYRIFHRSALTCLIIALLLLIISQVWQKFTLDKEKLDVFRAMYLIGQTYFTVFCIAPAVVAAISLAIPRTEVENFGAGRLRNKIAILLIATAILSVGQTFRYILAWIPSTPLIEVQRGATNLPIYLSKACFYIFNFVTEILVVIFFAMVRVDLRFHVPNGSRRSGDYSISHRDSHHDQRVSGAATPSSVPMVHQNSSSQTLHRYQSSIFEDTEILADSLKYPSSILEVDRRTGDWKLKRRSEDSTRTRNSISFAPSSSRTTLSDRNTDDIPPVPNIPAKWPPPDTIPRGTNAVLEHHNPRSRTSTPNPPSQRYTSTHRAHFDMRYQQPTDSNVGDAVSDTLTKLEMNSERNRTMLTEALPQHYSRASPADHRDVELLSGIDKSPRPRSQKRNTYPLNHPLNNTTRGRTHVSLRDAEFAKVPAPPRKLAPTS